MTLWCPICRMRWKFVDRGNAAQPVPKPNRLGVATCELCCVKPVPRHIAPNEGLTLPEPSPWYENAIRALEEAGVSGGEWTERELG